MMPTGTFNIHCNTKTLVPIGVIAVQQSCVQAATNDVTVTSRIRAGAAILAAAAARETCARKELVEAEAGAWTV